MQTYLERDVRSMRQVGDLSQFQSFLRALAARSAQLLNLTDLARDLGIALNTAKAWLSVLEAGYQVVVLRPYFANIGKRLVKRPKLYFVDSGIFHSLISVGRREELLTHPKLAASWEGFALECIIRSLGKRNEEFFFWSTHSGPEVDLFWQHQGKNWAAEFKYMDAPQKTRTKQVAMQSLGLAHLWVVYPGSRKYRIADRITVLPLSGMSDPWPYPAP